MTGDGLKPNEMTVAEARDVAETAESASNGVITERQMLAVLLYAKENTSLRDVGTIMGIEATTVKSHKERGMKKLIGAKSLMQITEGNPWWARVSGNKSEDSDELTKEKCSNCEGTGMVATASPASAETSKCPVCNGKGVITDD